MNKQALLKLSVFLGSAVVACGILVALQLYLPDIVPKVAPAIANFLTALIAAATGALSSLLVPDKPIEKQHITVGVMSSDPQILNLQQSLQRVAAAARRLNLRQSALRLALYGMLAFAFASFASGLLFPLSVGEPSPEGGGRAYISAASFWSHAGLAAGAYALVGAAVGFVMYFVRVDSANWQAAKTALISAGMVNLCSFLMAAPYIVPRFSGIWLNLFGNDLVLALSVGLLRVVILPVVAGVAAWLVYAITGNLFPERRDGLIEVDPN
jgi:hypothetical protein